MSYVLFCYCMPVIALLFLLLMEQYYQMMEIDGWWISQKNLIREKLIYPFKVRFKQWKVIPVYTRTDYSMLYYVTKDFLKLTYSQKFQVGMRLNILKFSHATFEEDQIDFYVLKNAIKNRKLPQLISTISQVRYEQS